MNFDLPVNLPRWKHTFGFYTRGVMWDTPMARWAREEHDWIQKLLRHPSRKDDEVIIPMNMLRQPTTHPDENSGSIPSKEPRDLASMVLEPRANTEGTELVIRGDNIHGRRLDPRPRKAKNDSRCHGNCRETCEGFVGQKRNSTQQSL